MPNFEEWLKELNVVFMKELGCTHDAVEDYDWWAEFEGEATPEESYEEWSYIAGPNQ